MDSCDTVFVCRIHMARNYSNSRSKSKIMPRKNAGRKIKDLTHMVVQLRNEMQQLKEANELTCLDN